MKRSLSRVFNETSAAAQAAFPRELKSLVVLLQPSSKLPVYVSPDIADLLTNNIAAVKTAVARITQAMQSLNAAGMAYPFYPLAGASVKLIALNKNITGVFSCGYTKKMRALFVLDHEIGHHVVKNGFPGFIQKNGFTAIVSRHLAECAADAYATLRHIQRFGNGTDFSLGTIADRNARNIVLFADAEHYTTDAMQRGVRLSQEMDISGLSLQETAELAEKIASECQLDYTTLEKIRAAFRPVFEACEAHIGSAWDVTQKLNQEDMEACKVIYWHTRDVMRAHSGDPDILKAGQRFLAGYPGLKNLMEAEEKKPAGLKNAGMKRRIK
jgi:hypothetical protein